MNWLSKIYIKFQSQFNRCNLCLTPLNSNTQLCPTCVEKLTFTQTPTCEVCGIMLAQSGVCINCSSFPPYYKKLYYLANYEDEIKKILTNFKFNQKTHHQKTIAQLIDSYHQLPSDVDYIVPVPLHIKRLQSRGFNQSLSIAIILSKKLNKPCLKKSLIRTKNTVPQSSLKIAERKVNLKNCFKCTDENLKSATILLVDDIFTSGSTINECAHSMLHYGAKKVYAFTVARTQNKY